MQQIVDRERASRGVSRNASAVRELRAALNRVAGGTHGVCVDSEDPIVPRRLSAVPWAARCLSCQEDFQTGGVPDEPLTA
jgi:DnaK suppressor protein